MNLEDKVYEVMKQNHKLKKKNFGKNHSIVQKYQEARNK